jgi:hypothetical protein
MAEHVRMGVADAGFLATADHHRFDTGMGERALAC